MLRRVVIPPHAVITRFTVGRCGNRHRRRATHSQPPMKTRLKVRKPAGLFTTFCSFSVRFVKNVPDSSGRFRPDYRRGWDIPVTTVRMLRNVRLSLFLSIIARLGLIIGTFWTGISRNNGEYLRITVPNPHCFSA